VLRVFSYKGTADMNRYDGLRRMREAKFAAKTTPPTVTKKVTENTYVNRATTNPPISVTQKLNRGRQKTGKALPGAERTRRYRARRKAAHATALT